MPLWLWVSAALLLRSMQQAGMCESINLHLCGRQSASLLMS